MGKASNIILAGFACAATACCVVAASAAAEPVPTKPSACIADLRDRLFAGEFYLENVMTSRSMQGVKPGTIKKLMVMETLPKPINLPIS